LECKTPVNILYANTRNVNGKAMGEMILQLPDSDEIADKMIDYFKSKNLGVKELTEDD
jgi:D-methionine transport system ATP-binding protein